MTQPPDTIATIALQLGGMLRPLQAELQPPNVKRFFGRLGIPLNDAQAGAISAPAASVSTAVGQLTSVIDELAAAVRASAEAEIGIKGIEAAVEIGSVVSGIDALATSVRSLAIPGVSLSAEQIAGAIFDTLVAHALDGMGQLNDVLELLGILRRDDHFEDGQLEYTVSTYDYSAIPAWLDDPRTRAQTLYGWGPGFDGSLLFPRLERFLAMAGLPVLYDAAGRRLDAVFLELTPVQVAGSPPGVDARLKGTLRAGEQTIQLGDTGTIELTLEVDPPPDTHVAIHTDGSIAVTPPSPTAISGRLGVKLTAKRPGSPPEPFILVGVAGGLRIEVSEFVVELEAGLAPDGTSARGQIGIGGGVNGGKVVIDTTSGDGFLAKILPGTKFEGDFDLLMGISSARGFYFGGSSALELKVPVHIDLGPIDIEALTFGVGLDGGQVPITVGADLRAVLGPLTAVVRDVGIRATLSFPPGNSGNLGPLEVGIGFKPPDGLGLRVEAGPVTGGGFLEFDEPKGEYFGALELSFQGVIALKAVAIVTTKMPDGSRGFSLLILVTAEFTPIQLGFGFALVGVGGLLALNRTLDTEALRGGVRSGGVRNVMFPQDVIGNIAQIISDLKSFFPVAEGHFVVAPMAKLGWGTPPLITLEVGVVLDIPSPQLSIIGVLRCILPNEQAPLLRLQVAFAGGVDFNRKLIWFDASLFDSNLLVYTLSGDMALRIGWGDEPVFVLSVGGFHPAFREAPPDLADMRRLTIALMSGNNPRLTAQTYFAVTSNTVQSGARVELYASACGFNVYGFLGYDLLVQFKPFYFVASIYAGLALRRGEDVIAGISVSCELSGPTPWRARGSASLEILFFEISIGFDETWGEPAPALPEDTEEVLERIVEAVGDSRNWRAELPTNVSNTVSLRQLEPPAGVVMLHPFGVLSVSQKVAPLELEIDRFGHKKPVGETRFTMAAAAGGGEAVREQFAVANFVTLSDSEKLSRKSFERFKSGLRFGGGDTPKTGRALQKEVSYELSYLRKRRRLTILAGRLALFKPLFDLLAGNGAIAASALSVSRRRAGGNGPATVDIADAHFHVVGVADLLPMEATMSVATEAEAYALQASLVRDDPALEGQLQVMAAHELAAAGVGT